MDENHLHCHQRHQHGLTSIPFPRAPRRDHDLDQIQQALNEGTISIYLQDSTVKMRLSLQCQLCPFTTTRLSGLFKHLSSDLATMLQRCWQGTCICNPAPVARRGHSCVGWKHLAMIYYNFMPLKRAVIMPCDFTQAQLLAPVHDQLGTLLPGLLRFFLNKNWSGILQSSPECDLLSRQCLFCAQQIEPREMLSHHVLHHAFDKHYGHHFVEMWNKQHLTQTAFVTPCSLCRIQLPKLSTDTTTSFQLLKHNCPESSGHSADCPVLCPRGSGHRWFRWTSRTFRTSCRRRWESWHQCC